MEIPYLIGEIGINHNGSLENAKRLILLAKHCNLEPNKLVHFIGDAHIYEQHVEPLKEQIKKQPNESPNVDIIKRKSIDDYKLEDFKLINYKPGDKIIMEMIA